MASSSGRTSLQSFISGARLASSATGATPPGVANSTVSPASVKRRYGASSSSAQNPVGCCVPSASVQFVAALTTKRIFDMSNS